MSWTSAGFTSSGSTSPAPGAASGCSFTRMASFEAFHSRTDDLWPIVHTPGFLSIVIPNFGVTFSRPEIFACEIGDAGQWQQDTDDRVRGIPEPRDRAQSNPASLSGLLVRRGCDGRRDR